MGYSVPEHVSDLLHLQMYVLKSMQLLHCSEVKLISVTEILCIFMRHVMARDISAASSKVKLKALQENRCNRAVALQA